ncbi:hypothetical protein LU11_gp316 [Pseudomonas phage Lu11]|uniref:hypothetical protein n=1 Tax=Pseudomonas phage Lu11 TaxID=1161927 RepID=UPI00025F1866|nr:hypothetical protein LU11_gp316 [Pseudomonas phage Lu11]AFH14847.1 hypothetical protein Lu11_0309 [Pseudomonas phage Lu11]
MIQTVLTTASVLFVTTFLRGIQNKSVAGGHKTLSFIGGAAMSACELLVTLTLASAALKTENPYLALFGCFGAGAGWVAGMLVHDRMMRSRREKLKAAKKTKRAQQIDHVAREAALSILEERGLL